MQSKRSWKEEEKERRGWGEVRGRGGKKKKKQAEDESRRRETPIKKDSRRRTRQGEGRKMRDYAGREETRRESSMEKWRSGEEK